MTFGSPARRFPRAFVTLVPVVACVIAVEAATSQVPPDAPWATLRTRHFAVHFTPDVEEIARRTAANAEWAYAQLARELTPPREPIDIVVADNVDFANGSATVFPSNRIYIYANPPLESTALRFNDDWNRLVVTHELAHIFHLDRVRGLWRLGQRLFGRAPLLFPNAYAPSWLTEGLAVYFESRLTGAGRLVGSEHRMIARATAVDHRFPRLDELSLATPRFPGGQAVYVYGSLIVDHLATRYGAERVGDLVERTSGQLLPYLLDRPARGAFGVSFHQAWRELRDSLAREGGDAPSPLAEWRDLTPALLAGASPRWMGDTAIVYTGASTRAVLGAYVVDTGHAASRPRRLGRRNSRTANVPLGSGGFLFTQHEFADPYRIRSDLYVDRGRRTVRLTRGARLSSADARRDGAIVAVQGVPGGARLVRVTADGRTITPITGGGPDRYWNEPRWSPDGRLIVAVEWRRGGLMVVTVLDTLGTVVQEVAAARAVQAAPSWSADGRTVVFTSDVSGAPDVYAAVVDFPAASESSRQHRPAVAWRVADAATGLFEPLLSGDGRTMTAVLFRADGYRVGVLPLASLRSDSGASGIGFRAGDGAGSLGEPLRERAAASPYSPWRSISPRYWLPLVESGLGNGVRFGAMTSGEDVVGRHSYAAQLLVPTDGSGLVGSASYRYAGLAQPTLGVAFAQDWVNRSEIIASGSQNVVGWIRRRTQDAVLLATWSRPRYRSSVSLAAGAGAQLRRFDVVPRELRSDLPADVQSALADSAYPRAFASAAWTNAYRSAYGVSPENGMALEGFVEQRWGRGGRGAPSRTYVGALTGYRSLDLPGFSQHVIAARAAGGFSDRNATTSLEVGGTSGGTLSVLPGYAIGNGRESFPVRGFDAAWLEGTRAVSASVEYRAPLVIPARGLRLLPLFLDRMSLSLFADVGGAWCPPSLDRLCYPRSREQRWIASVGGEINVNAAVLSWDEPYRFRFGVARPVVGTTGAKSVSPYVAVGLAF